MSFPHLLVARNEFTCGAREAQVQVISLSAQRTVVYRPPWLREG